MPHVAHKMKNQVMYISVYKYAHILAHVILFDMEILQHYYIRLYISKTTSKNRQTKIQLSSFIAYNS